MKHIAFSLVLLTLSFSSFSQTTTSTTDSVLTAADTVKRWDDMDLATTKWQEVKEVFVPKDLKTHTLLLETHTLEQHQKYFKSLITNYYLQNSIDTSIAKYKPGMSAFLKDQEKETHYIKQHYKGTLQAINEEEIKYLNTEEYRYVLKKILKIDAVDPQTGDGEARIEYYFYDRKEKKEFPHINAGYHWLITHLD